MFWSELGSAFGKPGGTPPPRIPRSIPPGYLIPVYMLKFSICFFLSSSQFSTSNFYPKFLLRVNIQYIVLFTSNPIAVLVSLSNAKKNNYRKANVRPLCQPDTAAFNYTVIFLS